MSERTIETAIQKLAGTFKNDPIKLYFGQVVSVELDNDNIGASTCTVSIKNDVPVPNVALQGAYSDGFLLVPTVGSQVAFIKSTKSPFAIITITSDLDQIYLQVQGSWLVLWGTGGEDANYTSGSFGGLLKLIDPNDPNAGVLAPLVAIQKDINTIKAVFDAWTPTGSVGDAGLLKSAASTWSTTQLAITKRSDIEDANITHGT